MDAFIDACIGRGRTIILILLMIFVLGISAFKNIPKEREPDVQIPFIFVSMHHEGISPEDAERLLIRPMEAELRSIEGVKEMTAYATEGQASVTLEFNAGFNSEKALSDVREKVDIAKAELPDDTDEPAVNEVNLSLFPVVNVILKGSVPERALVTIARDLRDKIEQIPNVLDVDIAGDRENAVEIILDPMLIESYGLTAEILAAVSTGFNRLVASGALDTSKGRYAIKVPGLLENLDDILSLPLKVNGDAVVTVRDIATIRKTFKDPQGYARMNGEPAIVLEVSKRTGTNLIDTIAQVKQVVEEEKLFLPEQITVAYSQDKSERILDMLNDLQNNIILAVLLVMVVIIYFIGMRSATLITISIPGAFLIGILILQSLHLTLNIVVLFSLILSIGMLVDAAIVVCEMADRKMTDGMSHKQAYSVAAKYMKWPLIASTATTLVVFMPLLFWPGIVGQFMQYLPITLIATLSGSLLMALIFVPTLGTSLATKRNPDPMVLKHIQITEVGNLDDLGGFAGKYARALKWVLSHAKKFTFVILAILVGVYFYYGMFGTGVEFFPKIDPDNGQVQIQARGNLSVDEKDALVKEVEDRILGMDNEVRVFYGRSGAQSGSKGGQLSADTIGVIQMEFTNWQHRRKADDINAEIQQRTSDLGGIIVKAQGEKSGPGNAKPIEIQISSRYPELLEPAVEKLLSIMQTVDGLVDIEDNRPIPEIEWEMDLDREMAARFGSNVSTVGNFIKFITNGLIAATYRPDDSDDEVDILVRFPEEKRNLSMLDALKVVTPDGIIPASNFVTRTPRPRVGTIHRTDGYRVLTVQADVAPGVLADSKVREIQAALKNLTLDPLVNIRFKGDDADQKEASSFLAGAFILALFCMALILVTQFNSLYDMAIILSAVFLSTVGVLIGLLITGQPFGIVMCGVGVISVSGIVVNNNIIFIDTYKKLRAANIATKEALMRTGVQRLRPILLTSGTTVLGLIPMVLGMNIDFFTREITFGAPSGQWWRQLSTTIAGGLSFATVLTLFLTPSLLLIGDTWFNRNKSSAKAS